MRCVGEVGRGCVGTIEVGCLLGAWGAVLWNIDITRIVRQHWETNDSTRRTYTWQELLAGAHRPYTWQELFGGRRRKAFDSLA